MRKSSWGNLGGTPSRAAFRTLCTVVAGMMGVGAKFFAAAWHYRVYSWRDYEVLGYMEKECHPVWRDFNCRRFGPGAELKKVIEETQPVEIKNYGDFAVLNYQGAGY